MEPYSFYRTFEELISKLFRDFQFNIDYDAVINSKQRLYRADMIAERNGQRVLIEMKFYRSKHAGTSDVINAIQQLESLVGKSTRQFAGLLILSSYIGQHQKQIILEEKNIQIWDRSDLYHLIKNGLRDDLLLDKFEHLLGEAKQGIDTEDVFADVEMISEVPGDYFKRFSLVIPKSKHILPPEKGRRLYDELDKIKPGKEGWSAYEKKCIEILKYLFEKDLSKWSVQNSTDDEINRFDMICRIVSENDFWKCLVNYYQSLYVLFEFKNYSKPITQDQIFTTERYLYLRGLRSVGFIIAKQGCSVKAEVAAKGALRENGKLLIILNNKDLGAMLDMKDKGLSASDYLSSKLDDFLIKLSR